MIRKDRQTGGLPDPLAQLDGLGRDVSNALLVEKGLADIVGVPPAPEIPDDAERDGHDRLVRHLHSVLNVDAGLAAVMSATGGHAVLVTDVSRVVDLERGLTQILEPPAVAEPPAVSSQRAGEEEGGVETGDDASAARDEPPMLDSLLKIYGAESRLRILLRTGNRYRYLRDAMRRLDAIQAMLEEMSTGDDENGRLRGVSTTLDLQMGLVEQAAAALAGALPRTRDETAATAAPDETEPVRAAPVKRSRSGRQQRKKKDRIDGAAALEQGHYELARGNPLEARQYYTEAADAGNADAIVNLAKLWTPGSRGILARRLSASAPEQLRAATELYRSFAKSGDADAAWYLAELLAATGASADEVEDCYQRAAKLGSRRARHRLLDVLRLAAEDGDPDSMSRLATVLNEYGKRSEAQMWSARAAAARREEHPDPDDSGPADEDPDPKMDGALLEDEVDPLLRQCADGLDALADRLGFDTAPVSHAVRDYCLWVAKQVAARVEQIWRALSDFEGADLQSAMLDPGLPALDGVRWSDGTSHQGVTLWPPGMRELIARESYPVAGLTGVFEVQFRHVVGAER